MNIKACAIRGKTGGSYWKNGIEIREDGQCYAITTNSKDATYLSEVKEMDRESKGFIYVEDDIDGYAKGGDKSYSVAAITKVETEEWDQEDGLETDVKPEEGKTVEDYLYTADDGEQYGIFKLSPRECLRLMGVKDSDIDKMAAVNSNTQLYKQAGNSIIVPVLCAIFSQLNIQGCKAWNEMSDEERDRLIMPEPIVNENTQKAILIKPEKCKEIAGG